MTLCRVTKSDGGVEYLLQERVKSIGDVKQAPGESAPVCLIRCEGGPDVYAKGTADEVADALFPNTKEARARRVDRISGIDVCHAITRDAARQPPLYDWDYIYQMSKQVTARLTESETTPVVPGPKVET